MPVVNGLTLVKVLFGIEGSNLGGNQLGGRGKSTCGGGKSTWEEVNLGVGNLGRRQPGGKSTWGKSTWGKSTCDLDSFLQLLVQVIQGT